MTAKNTRIFSVPVGDEGVQYQGVDIDEMETTGPQGIAVLADGTIAIVDTVGGRVLRYSPSGEKLDSVQLDGAVGISDAVAVGDDLVVLDEWAVEPAVFHVSSGGAVLERSALPADAREKGLSGIAVDDSGTVVAELKGGLEFLSADGSPATAKRGGATFAVESPSLADPSADLTRGRLLRDGAPFADIKVDEMLGGMNVLAALPSGEVFVLVEEVAFTPAVAVDQRVYRFAADGSLTGVARVPIAANFTYVKNGVAVGPDGTAYALVTRRDRADVVRLGFRPRVKRILPETVVVEEDPATKVSTCTLTRAAIEANVNEFLNNRRWYTLTALNGTCPGRGKPHYLGDVAGYYTSVSYDHYGSDSVSSFNSGIASGAQAGDVNKTQAESCSKGDDCSGFVTHCWALTTRYNTTTLQTISYTIPQTSVGVGDLMLKVGVHSALVDYIASNGLEIWDCSAYLNQDRAAQHWDTWTRFNAYTPRRYNNLCPDVLANGGFETGLNAWQVQNSRATLVTTTPQVGRYCVKLLGVGTAGSTWMRQAPSFPSTGVASTLRFWLKISSSDATTTGHDRLDVRIKSAAGTTLTTLRTFTNLQTATYGSWTQVSVAIPAAYAVAGNQLSFDALEDSSLPTTFFVDSVWIQ